MTGVNWGYSSHFKSMLPIKFVYLLEQVNGNMDTCLWTHNMDTTYLASG